MVEQISETLVLHFEAHTVNSISTFGIILSEPVDFLYCYSLNIRFDPSEACWKVILSDEFFNRIGNCIVSWAIEVVAE